MEIWKPVPGYEGLYEVSDEARVRRLHKQTPPRLKKQYHHKGGKTYYWTIKLRDGHRNRETGVHRLVALAFIGPIPEGYEVNHKNGIGTDNRISNLEIVTRSYNNWHANHIIRTRLPQQGSKHGRSILTEQEVLEIRARAAEGLGALSSAFDVSPPTISMILNRRTWRHI